MNSGRYVVKIPKDTKIMNKWSFLLILGKKRRPPPESLGPTLWTCGPTGGQLNLILDHLILFTRSRAFGHGSETIVSSPSRREVALASEDDTRGLADPPFQLWYETTFSSSLSTLNCSCPFCRRRLWHSVRGHCFPDQVRAVLDEPDPARSSFLI